VPWQSTSVSPVVPFIPMKTDHSNVLIWHFLQSQSPVPFFSALDTRQNLVSIDVKHSICGIRPRNFCVEELDDVPLWKQALCLFGVGELQRAQQKTLGVEFNGHTNR
jgi:hypothetical protein